MDSMFEICNKCVMDTSDSDISFDENSICNHCYDAEKIFSTIRLSEKESEKKINSIVNEVKKQGKGKEYDCVIGLSGGVDSSYTAYLATQLGLRPLAVHFDNGWNSEIAVTNIKNIVDKLDLDLVTHVIHWEDFKDLQRAFIKASVIDIEVPTDQMHRPATMNIAKKYGINFSLSGNNLATEHGMPQSWNWNKMDLKNLKSIHNQFGERKLKNYPTLSTFRWILNRYFKLGCEEVRILNYINYKKIYAMEILSDKIGWRNHGGKHYESVFTKFYQSYILPQKFGVDKRKVHLSALIRNGEITRKEAMKELDKPLYNSKEIELDKEFFIKKLGFDQEEFKDIMKESEIPHDYYNSDNELIKFIYKTVRKLKTLH